jgi:hypothetical protein
VKRKGVLVASVRRVVSQVVIYLALGPFYLVCFPCGGEYEQRWLDQAIAHLRDVREVCDDPDLCEVLDYTMARYHKVGRFNVQMQWCVRLAPCQAFLGYNAPWAPGLTLDYRVTEMPIEEGSLILVHEALHDYYPCFGHAHVTPRIARLRGCTN